MAGSLFWSAGWRPEGWAVPESHPTFQEWLDQPDSPSVPVVDVPVVNIPPETYRMSQ